MKSWIPAALVAGLSISGLAVAAADDPPRVDMARNLMAQRVDMLGPDNALDGAIAEWTTQLIARPKDPYSSLNASPALTNELYWAEVVDTLPHLSGQPADASEALDALRWDLGLTAARPDGPAIRVAMDGYDTAPLARMHNDPLIVAGLVKAHVDGDLFEAALRATTQRHSTLAATYAVAAQIIRDRSRQYPADRWKAMGVRTEVVTRLLAVSRPEDLTGHDRDYLGRLAGREVNRRRAGTITPRGLRELPTALRIARVAAAYEDGQGTYTADQAACFPNGEHRPGIAGTLAPGDTRKLCFADANDNAVYAWYAQTTWQQVHGMRERLHTDSLAPALLRAAMDVLMVIDVATAPAFLEKLMADDMVASRLMSEDAGDAAAERLNNLTCRSL